MDPTQRPVLDPVTLERLVSETGGTEVVREIVGLYLGEMPGRLELLGQGVGGGRDTLHRVAHSLRSSSALLGLLALESRCAGLESVATEGSSAAVDEMVAGVRECADLSTGVLREWLARAG